MKLSIIVPAYNERATIQRVVASLRKLPYDMEILIVDDGSTDGTRELLRELVGGPVRVFFHAKNQGKGAAIRTAIAHLTGDVAIVQDADLEYSPEDIPSLLVPIERDEADVVFGSRFLGGPHRVLNFWHYAGNLVLTLLSNMLTNLNLTDMETGYKLFRTSVLKQITLETDRFGFEPEITAKVARLGCRVYEQSISYHGRNYDEGKKITWRDGVAAIWHVLRFSLWRTTRTKKPVLEAEEIRPSTPGSRCGSAG